jgi:hypothetical protein
LAPLSWSAPFDDPIELPDGRKLITLHDAARFIQKLPKATHDLPRWQDAVEHLMRASAGSEGWLMFAHMFMLKALHHGREFTTDRKETHWGKRKLKRDE